MKLNFFRLSKNKANTSPLYLTKHIYKDDVFLVSYPKSGNTWVRFLIANLLVKKYQDSAIIDLKSIQKIIPEVGRNDEYIQALNRPRVMKSHATYIAEYPKVIYIVRDGRDVYTSYYFYRKNRLPPGTTFGQFLERQDHYPCLWGEHINSWLFRQLEKQKILIVKYEDLMESCPFKLKEIVDFIGLEVTEEQIQSAVEASVFENLQRLEIERGRPYKQEEGVDVFFRKGKVGNWQNFFGSQEKAIFKAREGNFLLKLGYETNNNW